MITKLFVSYLTMHGSLHRAKRIFSEAMETVTSALSLDRSTAPYILKVVVENVRPTIKIVQRHIGEVSYQIPVPVPAREAIREVVRRIVDQARHRNGLPMADSLARALLAAFEGRV